MKNIMRRIREYLNRKAVRRKLRSAISILSCIVVFSTTYALLLPALTLEAETVCGMEEHEHTPDCYTRVLICGQEESEGHHHTEECYDADGNLICGQEESEGHQHTDECYEMQLTCGKEVHVHSEACYKHEEPETAETSSGAATEEASAGETEGAPTGVTEGTAAGTTTGSTQSGAAGTTEAAAAATTQKAADIAEPEKLKEIRFERLLTGRTGIYYIPENGGSDDWEKLDDSTKLDPEQDVILHIAFEIPAGKLNATNAKTEYELPLSISMTEDEVDDINKYESRVFIGTDREADDLGNAGSFEIEEEYNGNGDVTERKAVITFNSDTCTKVGGEKRTDGTVTVKPETIEGFLEMTISAEDLLTLKTAGEAEYTLEWNDDGSLDTTVAFDAEKLQAYLDEKNGKDEEAASEATTEESAAAATTEEIAQAEEEKAAAEENATEEEAKAEEAEPVQEEAPAAAYASGKLDYDGGSYTVTASFDESAKLPEGVQLSVKELTGASYQKYLSEANEAVGENKEVTGGRFFDITFTDANGKPVEPQGMVDVRINYKNTETIEQGTNVEGVHFTDQGAQTIDVDAKGVAENTVDVVGFQSDSFSVYGVVYTVDFEYTDPTTGQTYYYSLNGNDSINLTELLVLLGIKTEENVEEFVANQVENVEFSDPELVKVTHNGKFLGLFGKDDWKLESLQPYDTEETLTISLKNGEKIVVKVTSGNIKFVEAGIATISTMDGTFLPDTAEGVASIVENNESAVADVEKVSGYDENANYQVYDIGLNNINENYYNGFHVEVKLPESIKGADFHLYHIHDGKTEEIELNNIDETTDENGLKTISGFSFNTDSFSEFVLKYTVDFEYEGRMLHFPGQGKYLLSDVLSELGIEGTIENAELKLVEGEDHRGALYLEQKKGEYWICSDIAFQDTYELDVKINNKIYTITVKDVSYDMKDAVSSVSADGLSGDTWTVKEGEQYSLHITFEETPSVVQFPTTGNTLTYQLPNNFKPNGSLEDEPVTLSYTEASVTHTITGCKYSVNQNGTVTITLTDFAKEKLAQSGDGKLSINLSGEFTEDNEHTDFGGGNVKDITVDRSKDVTINKTGEYKSEDNKVHYTVTVKADGSLTDVKVSDVISGTALHMDQDSLVIKGNSSTPTGGANSSGFNLTFPTMKNGETITIEYTASVDWSVIGEGKGTVEQTGNKVKVKPNEIPEEKEIDNNLENRISYNPLSKVSGETQDTSDPDTKIKPWTITINEQGLKNMRNTVITDTNDSTAVMHYAGDGIKIEKFRINADGTKTSQGSQNVSWDELEVDPETSGKWSYKITDDGNFMYVISYITEVDVTGKNGDTNVNNHVNDDKGDSSYSGGTVGPGSSKIEVDKQFGTATRDDMSWTVTMDIPATGLSKAIMVDTLPSSGKYQDTLNVDSLNVEGLEMGDSYVLTQSKGKFTLTFYKDEAHENPGLNATGRARKITVTFKTDNDPLWTADKPEDEHTNNVSFQGDNATVYDSDKGKVPQRGIEKKSNGYKTVTISGEEKIVFEYEIDLRGITDADFAGGKNLEITDDYDQEYVGFLDVSNGSSIDGLNVYGAQCFWNMYGGEKSDNKIVPADDGDKITFTVRKQDLPLNGQEYFKAYKLIYYMVANDSSKLLQDSLNESDRTLTIGNKVKWGDSEDHVDVDYGYPALVKENVAPSTASDPNTKYDSATGLTGFKIVINPDKLELNNGDPMTLEDVFSGNLSVDYSSIKIEVVPADDVEGDQTVTYDYKGNKGIYIIPDKCKVTITYDSRVIGNPGEWVDYGNEVTMNGFSDSASGRAWMGGSAEGSFNIYSVDLFKYSAGHMEVGLNGATFTLVDENGEPVVYPDAARNGLAGKPITFTTSTEHGKDGYVTISLNEQEDGLSLQKGITYYLKETVSPDTHAINNTIYRFTISDNPNYSNYEYHSGDIVKVYDWPVMGKIEINKEIEGPSNLTEEDKKKIKFEITGTYDDGTPIKVDEDGYPIEKGDLSKYSEAEKEELKDFKVSITYADFTDGKYVMADLVDGIYTVNETAAALPGYNDVATVSTTYEVDDEGARKGEESEAAEEATVTITDHSKYVMNYKNTYTNRTGGYDLIIKKVDTNNKSKTLYGAIFSLEKKEGNEYVTVTEGSVDEKGQFSIPYANKDTGVTLTGLKPGQYRITEIQAPTNYKATGDGTIEFIIKNDGTVETISGVNPLLYTYEPSSDSEGAGTFSIENDTKHSYKVTKVDGANVSLKLPGAEFGVWESSYPATSSIDTAMEKDAAAENPLWTYVTDENGQFEIQKDDHEFEEGKLYFFKEIQAPEGYELPKNPAVNYFYFSYDGTPPTKMKPVNLGVASRSQTITNDLPNLEVKKLWKNLKGDNLNKDKIDVDEIEFVVYQKATVKTSEGTIVSEGEEKRFPDDQTTYTIEYSDGNWTTVSIPNAPAMGKDEEGNFIYYSYRVEETVPDGWVAKVDMSDSGREATITNTPEPIDITVKKKWEVPGSLDPNQKDAKAYFEVYKKDDSGSWALIPINGKNENELNKGNSWEMAFQVENGGEYKIVETRSAPDDMPIESFDTKIEHGENSVSGRELEFTEGGDIEITNTYNEPYLEIRKVWETDLDTKKYEPKVRIYRREIGQENWEIWQNEVSLSDPTWSKTYSKSELPSDKQYEYYVEEISITDKSTWQPLNPNPFIVSYSASQQEPLQNEGTITVTNKKYDGEISVEKKWRYVDGSTAAKEGDTAKVILQRALADQVGHRVTLSVTLNNYQSWDHTYRPVYLTPVSVVVKDGGNVTFTLDSFYNSTSASCLENGNPIAIDWNQNQGGTISISSVTQDTVLDLTVEGSSIGNGNINSTVDGDPDIEITGSYEDVPDTEVLLDSSNRWSHTWDNLPLNAGNNQEYVYSVREIQVNGKMLSKADFISSIEGGGVQEGTVTVTNTEIAYGSLKITKNVTVGQKTISEIPEALKGKADGTYTFRIDNSEGKKVETVQITIENGVANTVEVPNLVAGTYTVTEIASTNPGVTIDMEPKTVEVVAGESVTESGIATITNDYNATGSVPFKAKKLFEDQTLTGGEFDFTLTEYTDDTFTSVKEGGITQTKHNDEQGDVLFDDINYSILDAGADANHPNYFYYIIKETKGTDPDIAYDETEYKCTVSVYDNGDGTLAVVKNVEPELPDTTPEGYDASFINQKVMKKPFEFKKLWKTNNTNNTSSDNTTWPEGEEISVTLYRNATYTSSRETKTVEEETVGTYSIPITGIEDSKISVVYDTENKWYTVKFDEQEKYVPADKLDHPDEANVEWQYYIKENPLDGFSIAYGNSTGTIVSGKLNAKDGESVINSLVAYALPETGGFGITPFYTIGLLLIAFAAGLYTYLNRKNLIAIRSDHRGSGTGRGKNRKRGGDGL